MHLNTLKPAAMTALVSLMSTANLVHTLNPIVQTRYTADPAPLVHNGRLWVFTGQDEPGGPGFDHGSPMSIDTFEWADAHAWASQAIERDGKFYWYASIAGPNVGFSIGVGVADNVEGPYRDAIGKPLVPLTEIYRSPFIDDDGQAWLYWGNPSLLYLKLNDDITSFEDNITKYPLDEEGFSTRVPANEKRPTLYEEGPWLFKWDDLYYLL
ncbi:hypothetical protein ACHAP5_009887 [Fusarium lateritium]